MTERIEDRGYTPAESVDLDFVADHSTHRDGARQSGVDIANIDLKYCADGSGFYRTTPKILYILLCRSRFDP